MALRHPGKGVLTLLLAIALLAGAGFLQGPNFTVASGYDHRASGAVTVKGASAVPLQVSPERAGTSAMRGLGYALLAVGALAARKSTPSGPRATKVVVHFQAKPMTPVAQPTAACESNVKLESKGEATEAVEPEPLIDLGPPAVPAAPAPAFGAHARHRRARRRVGAKLLAASTCYEMPTASFDASQIRMKIQTGLSIGASPKVPRSRGAARSAESTESDQVMAELLFRSYNGRAHKIKESQVPLSTCGAVAPLIRDKVRK